MSEARIARPGPAANKIRWRECPDADAMATAVAAVIGEAIELAIAARGVAAIALSGGRTPYPAYRRLAELPLEWDRVIVLPSDDRLVAPGHPLSNVTAMRPIFEPLGAHVEPLDDLEPAQPNVILDPRAAGRAADQRLRDRLPWPLDFVLLGVGTDGHTASIFPGEDYDAALDLQTEVRVLGVTPDPLPPEAPVARVSFSLAAIVAARTVAVAVIGKDKRAVIDQAIAQGANSQFPIGRVLAAVLTPVDLYWAPE